MVDVLIAVPLSVAVIQVILVLALGSAITLHAWPFFSQERVGRRGRPFRIVKIRTLPPDTPKYADKYQLQTVRVPAFCQLLRNLHLDELPQLFLVVMGRMSLVGPRPEMPTLHVRMPLGFRRRREELRPGCSGLWQIGDRAAGLISEAPQYDDVYVRSASLRLDAWVLWRTVAVMCGVGKLTALTDVPSWALRHDDKAVVDLRTQPPISIGADLPIVLERATPIIDLREPAATPMPAPGVVIADT